MHLPRMRNQAKEGGDGPDEQGIVHTGSISSTVDLDFNKGEAHKVYHPSFPVRLLYRLVFQAPFPYVASHPALEAARLRRRLVDILTKYWFGHHLVAPVLGVDDVAGGAHDFVTRLIPGHEPGDEERAKAFLKDLDVRFMETGISTWQITPYNPHSITNLMEQEDGTYRIIDLESSLVAHLYPLSGIVGLIRAGLFPSFDDVDCDALDAYLARNAEDLQLVLGDEQEELLSVAAAYRQSQDAWHKSEPRLINRTLRFLLKLVDVPSWVRGIKRLSRRGEDAAKEQLEHGLEQWVEEGRIQRQDAQAALAALAAPEVERTIAHLGVHFAISLPLRFPLGATARFLYTVGLRISAEVGGLSRRGDAGPARRIHTLPVALFALLPGFGRLAYFLSPAVASQPLLMAVPLDRVSRKLPGRVYERLHLGPLFSYLGTSRQKQSFRVPGLKEMVASIRRRHKALGPFLPLVWALVFVNATVFAVGTVLYLEAARPENYWYFHEFGVTQSLEAVELLVAGFAGIGAFRSFWRTRAAQAPLSEAAGIFLWGIGGIGLLVCAFDNYFGIHERIGRRVADAGIIPEYGNLPEDILVVGYAIAALVLLGMFRHEVLASRNSTALLIPASIFSLIMVGVDVFAESLALKALEFPAQTLAVTFLTLAFVVRYLEVRVPVPKAATNAISVGRA